MDSRSDSGYVGLVAAIDFLSVLVVVLGGWFRSGVVLVLGVLGLWLSGPIIHGCQGRWSAMVRSLALRTMGPVIGTLGALVAGILLLPGHDPTENGVLVLMMGAGLVVGTATGIAADWANTKVTGE